MFSGVESCYFGRVGGGGGGGGGVHQEHLELWNYFKTGPVFQEMLFKDISIFSYTLKAFKNAKNENYYILSQEHF